MTTVKLVKKASGAKATGPLADAAFVIQENGDSTYTVFGTDSAGNLMDISGVAALTVVSSAPTILLKVEPPIGMTFKVCALGPIGSATVTITVTWNPVPDHAVPGPFVFTLPFKVVDAPKKGVDATPGVPTVLGVDHVHSGKIVSIEGLAVTMSHTDGSPSDAHTVSDKAKITLNGAAVPLADLKAGDDVVITGDPATSVAATRAV